MVTRIRRRLAWWLSDLARWLDPDWSMEGPALTFAQRRRILRGVLSKIKELDDEPPI